MIKIHKTIGGFQVDGLPGQYEVRRNGAWNRVYYVIPDQGVELIGSVPAGIYGDHQFDPTPNRHATDQIRDLVERDARVRIG